MAGIAAQPAVSETVQRFLRHERKLLIDGKWVSSSSGARIASFDPSTGREIASVVDATTTDVDRAVGAARRAFDDGRWTGLAPAQREQLLMRLAELIETHAGELAELEALDNGKTKAMAGYMDIPASVAQIRYFAGWITKVVGQHGDLSMFPAGAFHAYVRREPIGVAAQIVPWNFPLVVCATRFTDVDEVAALANDTEFGLAASVWTRDVSAMHKLAQRLKAGTVWGNCHSMIDPALPFGGYKQSGFGREQGLEGMLNYTETKSVIIAL